MLLGFAFLNGKIFSKWLSISTILFGLATMGLILFIHDNFEIYKPLFHIKTLWLIAMGTVLLTKGMNKES